MRNFNINLKLITTFLSIMFLLTSCSHNDNEHIDTNNDNIINDNESGLSVEKSSLIDLQIFEEVGIQHNIGLELIFNQLDQSVLESFETFQTITDFNRTQINLFLDDNILIHPSLENFYNLEVNNILEDIVLNVSQSNFTPNFVSTTSYFGNFWNSLSTQQKNYLNQLLTVLDDELLDSNRIASAFDLITNDAMRNLSNEELIPIIAASEVGKASALYWESNFEDWIEVGTGESYETIANGCGCRSWFKWRNFARADLAGAAAGAASGAAAGAGAGGVGAGPGAAAGALAGGLGASAGEAVTQIWNHIF